MNLFHILLWKWNNYKYFPGTGGHLGTSLVRSSDGGGGGGAGDGDDDPSDGRPIELKRR